MFQNQANEPLLIEGPNAKSEYRAQMADGTWTQYHSAPWWRGNNELHRAVRRYIVAKRPGVNRLLTMPHGPNSVNS